jgi:alpha-ketoglutarate-dependent taurine dioxygenase
MIYYDTPNFIFKVGKTNVDEVLSLGPTFWKNKLYTHNNIIIDGIKLDKSSFNEVSNLFGNPWPEELYLLHSESLSDKENIIVNWNHDTGLRLQSLPWHQDNPWNPIFRFPIRTLYSLEVEDPDSGILSFVDTVDFYNNLDVETKNFYNNLEILVHDYRNPERKHWYPFVQKNLVTGESHLLINAIDLDINFFGFKKSKEYKKGKTHIIAARNKLSQEEFKLEHLADEFIKCVSCSKEIYNHKWKENQLVVFSNLNVIHCRTGLKENARRIMYRRTIFHDYQYEEFLKIKNFSSNIL